MALENILQSFLNRKKNYSPLRRMEGLAQDQFDIVCGTPATKLSPSLIQPKSWPCSDIEG